MSSVDPSGQPPLSDCLQKSEEDLMRGPSLLGRAQGSPFAIFLYKLSLIVIHFRCESARYASHVENTIALCVEVMHVL